jgi:hypothetical protein
LGFLGGAVGGRGGEVGAGGLVLSFCMDRDSRFVR